MAGFSRTNSKRLSKRDDGTLYKAFQTALLANLTEAYRQKNADPINGALLLLAARAQQAINKKDAESDLNADSLLTSQFDDLTENDLTQPDPTQTPQQQLLAVVLGEWSKRRPTKPAEESLVDTTPRGSVEDILAALNLT